MNRLRLGPGLLVTAAFIGPGTLVTDSLAKQWIRVGVLSLITGTILLGNAASYW